MTIYVSWLIEHRVMYVEARGEITLEHIATSIPYIVSLMEQSNHALVHRIVVNAGIDKIPLNVFQLRRAIHPLLSHPQNGWHVFVNNQNSILDYSVHLLAQIFKARWRKEKDFQAACDFLYSVDQTLPLIPATIPEPLQVF